MMKRAATMLSERGLLPDGVVRAGIRRLLAARLARHQAQGFEGQLDARYAFVESLRGAPVAVATDKANEQHYELPPPFFETVLGPRLKYSSCLWDDAENLGAAEDAMLELTCRRAGVENGMQILELGCGWGSLTQWMAAHYPDASITAVSNSAPQREFIEKRCRDLGFDNVRVITADMRTFSIDATFDRVVSVEMFEHMRNIPELFRRVRTWLKPEGKLFVHVFCHRDYAYLYETEGGDNWMAELFFTGGMMPAEWLYFHCQDDLCIERHWRVNGRHYARTLRAWLERMDRSRWSVMPVLKSTYGSQARVWWHRWRIFFMACEELFAYRNGEEWYVAHYLLGPRHATA